MKHARLATAVALFWGVISLLWPTAVEAWQNPISSWNTVRLKATTEDDFVYRFGIPDEGYLVHSSSHYILWSGVPAQVASTIALYGAGSAATACCNRR